MHVKVISSDGHELILEREHMQIIRNNKAMLSGPGQFAENEIKESNFRELLPHMLRKVCMYFTYKVHYTSDSTDITKFLIAPETALELLMAANFQDCLKEIIASC
ncbi:elongin-C-like [Mesocricetus auratus]|uniref:Elongin-C n=1 Tax=Mesocricetus auratus TaxID=10036 RepID=A0ABM2XM88_MESAU|nr:elongin-C-like [Mesocricetus auratus]